MSLPKPPGHLDIKQVLAMLQGLPPEKRQVVEEMVGERTKGLRWVPNPGYQTLAFKSLADELFAGGMPGGGKSCLLVGTATSEHTKSIIFRREYPQIKGLEDEAERILGNRNGYNAQTHIWRLDRGRTLEFGSVPHENDKTKYQGRPHDLKGFDEIAHFSRSQYRYLTLWLRSPNPKQRSRIIATGNPPETPEGLWVIGHWAPWLDDTYPDPAEPGELRWAAPASDNDDKDLFFRSLEDAVAHIKANLTDPIFFDTETGEPIPPRSRTFVPLPLDENQDYVRAGYKSVLAFAAREHRKLAAGEFSGALPDHPDQVIPTAWIIAAQDRWLPDGHKAFAMTAMGFDPAGGGRDAAVLAFRHGGWFGKLVSEQGASTAEATTGMASILMHRRNNCPVVVDHGGGFAGAIRTRLSDNGIPVVAFNGANDSTAKAVGTNLPFANKRAEAWWRFREALDPDQEGGSIIALPPDPELRADLAAPRLKPRTLEIRGEILLESKDEIRARLGRSPGRGDAVVMSLAPGNRAVRRQASGDQPPRMILSPGAHRQLGVGYPSTGGGASPWKRRNGAGRMDGGTAIWDLPPPPRPTPAPPPQNHAWPPGVTGRWNPETQKLELVGPDGKPYHPA